MRTRHPRVAIDCRLLHWPGVGRYLRELSAALVRVAPQLELRWICDAQSADALPRGPRARALPVRSRPIGGAEQLELPWRLLREGIDLLHAPVSHSVPLAAPRLVVTLHDLAVHHHADFLPSPLGRLYYRAMNAVSLRRARRVLCVSRFTRDDAAALWPALEGKLRAVPNGVSARFRPVTDPGERDRAREALELPRRFLLFLGTRKRHKNLPRLIRAYGRLDPGLRRRYPLLIVAAPDPRYPEVDASAREAGVEKELLWRAGVPEAQLPALYSMAHALVLPSLYEGFGLPVAEALACGTPVAVSRAAALPEVCGDAGLLFDPRDVDSIATALDRLLGDAPLRAELASRARRRAEAFSWDRVAESVAAVYREALPGGAQPASESHS